MYFQLSQTPVLSPRWYYVHIIYLEAYLLVSPPYLNGPHYLESPRYFIHLWIFFPFRRSVHRKRSTYFRWYRRIDPTHAVICCSQGILLRDGYLTQNACKICDEDIISLFVNPTLQKRLYFFNVLGDGVSTERFLMFCTPTGKTGRC